MKEEIIELKKIITEKGYSQEKVARSLGVSFATVNRWLREHNNPSELALYKIRVYLRQEKSCQNEGFN